MIARAPAVRMALAVVLVLTLGACQPVALTNGPPSLSGVERAALWLAVGLVPLVAAAITILRPGRRSASPLVLAGAIVYAAAGFAVLLALAVGAGAVLRAGGLACSGVTDPDAPTTLLQLGCTPGYDHTGLLLAACALVALPLAAALIGAALTLANGHGVAAFAPLAAIVCGGAIQGALFADTNSGALRLAVGIASVAGLAAACLLADLLFVATDQSSEQSA